MTKKKHEEAKDLAEEQLQAEANVPENEVIVENEKLEEGQPAEDVVPPVAEESEPKETVLLRQMAELQDKHLRLMAEFDNYRKRTLKEKADLIKTGGESVIINILPIVDDMERAMKSMETAQDIVAVKEGVNLIFGKFSQFLSQNGVKEVEASGMSFDTDKHEAITNIPAPSEEMKGKVIDVVQKGYSLHDKVIRFSKVVVGE